MVMKHNNLEMNVSVLNEHKISVRPDVTLLKKGKWQA